MNLKHLTDAALLARLDALVSQERGGIADLIEHLAEVDRREIVIDAGYVSLFDYCVKVLRYSEAAAFLRIRAARAAAKYPRVLADLRSGTIHLDAVMRLYPYLRDENSDRLLSKAAGASKRDVLALVASLSDGGAAPERDIIRRLPEKPHPQNPPAQKAVDAGPEAPAPEAPLTVPLPSPGSGREGPSERPETAPPAIIAPSRIRLAFTADDEFVRMVDRLRSLRRHKFPDGRLEDILKEAVDIMLHQLDPGLKMNRKSGKELVAARPGRRVAAAVKAEAWKRDDGCCAYTAPDGRRCESRDFLEYDHIVPWALGGLSVLGNIRLLCRRHNQRLAKRRFGPRWRTEDVHVRPDAVELDE